MRHKLVWLLLLPGLAWPGMGWADSVTMFAGAGTNDDVGDTAWATPGAIVSDDDARTRNVINTPPRQTDRLRSSSYGFAIPAGATITGIEVAIGPIVISGSGTIADFEARLCKSGSPVGDDKSSATLWGPTETVRVFGSSSDLWGTTWTPGDINDTNFGFGHRAISINALNATADVDYHKITVYYTPAAPVPSQGFGWLFGGQ